MEIKDPIHGTIDVNRAEVAVLDSPAFQRLRLIKQLGFSEFSFPGATHNRYIHSLGVCHLVGQAFDSVFKGYVFSNTATRTRLRQVVRLAALLHDIGHGPLSHTTEEVMPKVRDLKIEIYNKRKSIVQDSLHDLSDRQADHEDYTIKFLTDSHLTQIIQDNFSDIPPQYVAYLVDKSLVCDDDFFIDQGLNFRPILSQMVSSELDCDRMDYLARDSYFCGTNYGVIEHPWIISNLTFHIHKEEVFLALNRRALYTFDDFLISRHHMYLMVYFHHKSIVYEEMLYRYLTSPDCDYKLPADIEEYRLCNDYSLYQHLAQSPNIWAQKITWRQPYRVVFEQHSTKDTPRLQRMRREIEGAGIDVIMASSRARLSKYHSGTPEDRAMQIYVVDHYDPLETPVPIDQCTEIFQKYEETRNIERIYVDRDRFDEAKSIIVSKML